MSDRIALWPIHEARLPPIRELADIGAKAYMMKGCRILVSHDPEPDGSRLWHLSISRPDRDPSWGEIATARYRLLPEVPEMAMYLPPLDEYVNLHPFTFHLHEVPR
jgi:hypothetical protein